MKRRSFLQWFSAIFATQFTALSVKASEPVEKPLMFLKCYMFGLKESWMPRPEFYEIPSINTCWGEVNEGLTRVYKIGSKNSNHEFVVDYKLVPYIDIHGRTLPTQVPWNIRLSPDDDKIRMKKVCDMLNAQLLPDEQFKFIVHSEMMGYIGAVLK